MTTTLGSTKSSQSKSTALSDTVDSSMTKMAVPSFQSYRTVLYPVARLESQSMVLRIIDQILNFLSSRKSSLQGSGHVVLMSSKMLGENVTVCNRFYASDCCRVSVKSHAFVQPTRQSANEARAEADNSWPVQTRNMDLNPP
jgi:hypothetical protein